MTRRRVFYGAAAVVILAWAVWSGLGWPAAEIILRVVVGLCFGTACVCAARAALDRWLNP